MCGICGICYRDDRKIERNILVSMNSSLVHRGPDDEGFYLSDGVGLAMRRLQVIDLETGNQPIFNEDESVCVVYNGEIYNFIELRNELMRKGHIFRSKTDTEVIVHLYEDYGIEFVNMLNGMFAFALWDNRDKALFLVRDQFGIKPMYYCIFRDGIAFASELKALLRLPEVKPEIDLLSVKKYLIYEYIPAPRSIFRKISKLPSGHFLKYKRGNAELKKYWYLEIGNKREALRMPEVVEELRDLISDSVRRRLVSDVPVGAFLSGGIDSSTVAFFMTALNPGKVKTFSIAFDDASFDERIYSQKVSRELQTEHHEDVMSHKVLMDAIPKVIEFLDEPIGDASIIPTYLLSRFTRKSVTVALSGDGGDELFAGYPTYQANRLAEYYRRLVPEFSHRILIKPLIDSLPVSFDNFSLDFKMKRFIKFAKMEPYIRNTLWMGSFSPDELEKLLLPGEDNGDVYEDVRNIFNETESEEVLEKIQFIDFMLYLQDDILTKVDRASMACSLEVRIPFLDPRLVKFMWSLPFRFKMRIFTTKFILKKAMKGRLPGSIIKRKKKGFGIPVAKWFAKELREMMLDTFSETRLRNSGLFSTEFVKRLINEHLTRRFDHRKKLWTMFIFQHWYEKYGRAINC